MAIAYTLTLVAHIIGVIVAVGSATIVDYLHLISLRKKNLEKGLTKVYPHITKLINYSLVLIFLSGFLLVAQKPELLSSGIFRLKVALVLIVTINGIYLQRKVAPELDKCILNGTKFCTPHVLNTSAVSGAISITTWYTVFLISMTKTLGYTWEYALKAYLLVLAIAATVAYLTERRARKWRL